MTKASELLKMIESTSHDPHVHNYLTSNGYEDVGDHSYEPVDGDNDNIKISTKDFHDKLTKLGYKHSTQNAAKGGPGESGWPHLHVYTKGDHSYHVEPVDADMNGDAHHSMTNNPLRVNHV
jgi:hypothetical protein